MYHSTKAVSKPYFRDWTNIGYSQGKTFVAPTSIFKASKALYFPNLEGITLASLGKEQDTTSVLAGQVSVVSVFCSTWAENQTLSFVQANADLDGIFRQQGQLVQKVEINVEEHALKAMLIKFFMSSLRRKRPAESHGRYFLVRRGITEQIRLQTGMVNSKVGYVYVLDDRCRIRWAGCGSAWPGEKESLVKAVMRVAKEHDNSAESDVSPEVASEVATIASAVK